MEELMNLALAAGHFSIAVTRQGPHWMLAVLNRDGKISDPRNWDTQPTLEAAIADLKGRLGALETAKRRS